MPYFRFPQLNCRNNRNRRPYQNKSANSSESNLGASLDGDDDKCHQQSCCNDPRYQQQGCCNDPRCQHHGYNRRYQRCNDHRCQPQSCCEPRCEPCCDQCCEPRCEPCCEPCCEPRRQPQPCCNERRCQPCYDEADYQVDVIWHLFEEYNQIERKADSHFNNAMTNLCVAMEEIERGLECNKEGCIVWGKMEHWLERYYERFGAYCGCIEKMHEFRVFVKKLLIHEWASLEATKIAHNQLEESRCLDKELYILKSEIEDHCIPKC